MYPLATYFLNLINILGSGVPIMLYILATYFLNLFNTLGSGVPIISCILAIWSTSLEPGNKGCKLKENNIIKGINYLNSDYLEHTNT